jgi:hypothetical protein
MSSSNSSINTPSGNTSSGQAQGSFEGPPQEISANKGFSLSYKGKTLLSRIDPIGQAERIANSLTVKERTLYVCPSPLYGYGLALLLEKLRFSAPGTLSAILCVEADDSLFELSQRNMKTLLNEEGKGRMILVKLEPGLEWPGKLCALVKKTWGERRFRRVETLHLSGGWQLFPEDYEKTEAILQRDIAITWGNAMTLIRLGRLYIRNAIRNLALINRCADISTLDFGKDPVLVLGAGPGMDLILDKLKDFFDRQSEAKRPFRIICADTCIPSLKERGCKPDLVVVLESQHWNLRDFSGARGWEVSAAVDLSSLPASTRVLGAETFLFMTPWTELRLFRRLEEQVKLPSNLTPLGSVGLSAVELAQRSGSGPIVTAGIDFSFTLDAYHARSSPGHLARLGLTNRFKSLINVETAFREGTFATVSKSGLPVRSDPAMRNYRNLFEEAFSASDRIYEIKGPGLLLGARELSLEEAVTVLFRQEKNTEDTFITVSQKSTNKLASIQNDENHNQEKQNQEKQDSLKKFIKNKKDKLLKLRDILTGKAMPEASETEALLDFCDYLWAHFPECAAAGGSRPLSTDLSFLKRVRAEIDAFLKLWDEAQSDEQKT